MRIALFALLGLLGIPGLCQDSTVVGRITDEQNRQIEGATVFLHMAAPPPRASPREAILPKMLPYMSYTKTEKDGSFTFVGVPPGDHRLCIQAATRTTRTLDPCQWSARPILIRVPLQSGKVDVGRIQLERGHPLRIEIQDDGGLLDENYGPSKSGTLSLTLQAKGANPRPVPMVRSSARLRFVQVLVPYETDIDVYVHTVGFDIDDTTGQRIASEAQVGQRRIRVERAESDTERRLQLRITGFRAQGTSTN